jgi:hypothetical protein
MPPRKGQVKLGALVPPTTEAERSELRKKAYAGRFEGTESHEIMRAYDSLGELNDEAATESLYSCDNALVQIRELIHRHGELFGVKVRLRDAKFFRDLADCLESFSQNVGERPANNQTLFALARAPDLLVQVGPYTTGQLQKYLLKEWGIKCHRAEVLRYAKIAGLPLDHTPGRRKKR